MKNWLLYIALLLSLFVYSFWTYFSEELYFNGNAIYISLLCWYIWINDKKSFVKFALSEFSTAFLIKEFFFDATKLYLLEALNIVLVPLIWYIRYGKYYRILERNFSSYWRDSFVFIRQKIRKDSRKKK